MAESQAPAAPAAETPAPVAVSKTETQVVEASPTSDTAPKATETKAVEAAAEKSGAEQVAKDKWELIIDGEPVVLNEKQMIEWAQKGRAGQKRMQEAIEFQKQTKANWEALQKQLKENPESILEDEHIGHNKIELAKKWLAEKLEQDAKSPEQLKLEAAMKKASDLERQLKERDQKEQELLRQQQEAQEQREIEHSMKALESEMLGAFKKYQLPNSSAMVDRMTGIMEVAEKNGIQVSVDDVAKIVRDEIKKDFQELAALLPDEDFESFMGEGVTTRIKNNTLKKSKSSPKLDVNDTSKATPTEEKPSKKIHIRDFMKPDFSK